MQSGEITGAEISQVVLYGRVPSFELAKPNFRFHIDSEWCKFLDHMFSYRKVSIRIVTSSYQL